MRVALFRSTETFSQLFNNFLTFSTTKCKCANRCLDEHRALVSHGPQHVQGIDRLVRLYHTHRRLHHYQHTSPANSLKEQKCYKILAPASSYVSHR